MLDFGQRRACHYYKNFKKSTSYFKIENNYLYSVLSFLLYLFRLISWYFFFYKAERGTIIKNPKKCEVL